jgi:hypothetical protein
MCTTTLPSTGLGPPVGAARRRRAPDRRVRRVLRRAEGRLVLLRAPRSTGQGCVERLQDFIERSFEPGRTFANELDFQLQLDTWFAERANPRMHKTLRCRPIDRLIEERGVMVSLPAIGPDVDRRWVLRVPPDPYLRVDTCDYSLDPRLVGRKVEVRVSDREIAAVALDTAEVACQHRRSFAKHRTITALEHARTLKGQRAERRGSEPEVEVRSLDRYDALIA